MHTLSSRGKNIWLPQSPKGANRTNDYASSNQCSVPTRSDGIKRAHPQPCYLLEHHRAPTFSPSPRSHSALVKIRQSSWPTKPAKHNVFCSSDWQSWRRIHKLVNVDERHPPVRCSISRHGILEDFAEAVIDYLLINLAEGAPLGASMT